MTDHSTEAPLRALTGPRSCERGLGHLDAVTLRRAHFDARHTLPTHRRLRTAAQAAGCWRAERKQALSALRARTAQRPANRAPSLLVDVLAVRLRLAAPLTRRTGTTVCERLAALLVNIRDCHHHLGTTAEFTACLTDLRAARKRKRNLLRLLDERGR